MNVTTIAARGAAALVAAVAGAASYQHIASVAIGAGERPWVAYSLPVAVDGLIVVGVAALLEDKRADRVPRSSARLAVAVGVLATLAANIASAQPTVTARLVAVAAPVAFLLAVEVLTRTGRLRGDEPTVESNASAHVSGSVEPAELVAAGEDLVDVDTPTDGADTAPAKDRAPRRRSADTAARVAKVRAERPDATAADIGAVVGVSARHVRRLAGHNGKA